MAVLSTRDLSKSYGAEDIFEEVSVDVPHGAKIALVGPNGAGKTTFLRILIGEELPTEGDVFTMKGLTTGYLPQLTELTGDQTVWEEMLSVFTDLIDMERRLSELEARMVQDFDNVAEQYGRLQHAFEAAGGYTYEHQIRYVLGGLGFEAHELHRPLSLLSGGERTRALLGRLLLEKPDLLLLDEPTNHLDIEAVAWLESYLKEWQGAMVAVSHDRYFMDQVAEVIWEMDWGRVQVYRGNYSAYVRQREERYERLLAEYEAQQVYIEKQEQFIRRTLEGQKTKQAQSRRKLLERFKAQKAIRRPQRHHKLRLRLRDGKRSGDKVLMTHDLVVGYPDGPPLFQAPDITLYRTELAALIGPNGAGKTSFLKTVMGEIVPKGGEVEFGASLNVGYLAQGYEDLDPEKNVMQCILDLQDMPISEARNYLATYLFTGDDVFKPVDALSGGERARVALARLSLLGANFLLLDEPTNHLDIPSQEILQEVMANYGGTILLVSHDRYLIDALATQIWYLSREGELTVYEGAYKPFLRWREEQKARAAEAKAEQEIVEVAEQSGENGSASHPSGLSDYQRARRVAELEARIEHLEAEMARLNTEIANASGEGVIERVAELGESYTRAESELDERVAEWAFLSDEA